MIVVSVLRCTSKLDPSFTPSPRLCRGSSERSRVYSGRLSCVLSRLLYTSCLLEIFGKFESARAYLPRWAADRLFEEPRLTPKKLPHLPRSPLVLTRQGMQGTPRTKKPHVVSAQAQKRSGAIKYILSSSCEKVIVVDRRTVAEIEALLVVSFLCRVYVGWYLSEKHSQ